MSIDHRVLPQRRRALASTLTLALAVMAAGCAATEAVEGAVASEPSVEDEPQEALRNAVAALGDWEGLEATFRLDADEDVRAEAMSEGELTGDEVDLLLGSSIEMRAGGLDEPETAGFEAAIVVDGASVVDLQVSSDERFFLRVDAEALAHLSGNAELDDHDDLVIAARMFGLGDAARAAADGRWVELIGVEDVMESADAGALADAEEPEVDDGELEAMNTRIATAFERFVDEDVAVSHVGSDDVGEQVRLTTDGASLEALFEDLTTAFDRAGLLEDSAVGELDEPDVDPDMVVSMDAWIEGGELRQLAVDLAALDGGDELPGEPVVLIALEEFTGTITEPDDAEPFDVLPLVGAFLGGMGDGPSEGGSDLGDPDALGDIEGFEGVLPGGDGGPGCISEDELDLIEEYGGSEEMGQLEELFENGVLERC